MTGSQSVHKQSEDFAYYQESVWPRLPCCISKGRQDREFLDICLTAVFGVRNFQNTSAMRVIFFENAKKFIYICKMQWKILKKFFFLELIASELAALNCLY